MGQLGIMNSSAACGVLSTRYLVRIEFVPPESRTVDGGGEKPPLRPSRMTQWSLNPIASFWLLVLLTIGVAAISLLPTFKPMLRWQRASLIGLRLTVVFLALLLMLRPTRVSTVSRPVSAW